MKNSQNVFKKPEYEEIISNNKINYIKSGKLLSLPISNLYRIVTKYQQKNRAENITAEMQTEFVEFLFKCLDKFGIEASILFDHFNIEFSDWKIIRRLLADYSKKFDFHFINAGQLKTVYDLECQIIEREKRLSFEIENQQLREKERQNEFDMMKANMEQERARINRERRLRDEAIKKQQEDFMQRLEYLNEQVRVLTEKVAQQNGLIENLNRKIKEHEEEKKRQEEERKRQEEERKEERKATYH